MLEPIFKYIERRLGLVMDPVIRRGEWAFGVNYNTLTPQPSALSPQPSPLIFHPELVSKP